MLSSGILVLSAIKNCFFSSRTCGFRKTAPAFSVSSDIHRSLFSHRIPKDFPVRREFTAGALFQHSLRTKL
jgi:hypothetical protein